MVFSCCANMEPPTGKACLVPPAHAVCTTGKTAHPLEYSSKCKECWDCLSKNTPPDKAVRPGRRGGLCSACVKKIERDAGKAKKAYQETLIMCNKAGCFVRVMRKSLKAGRRGGAAKYCGKCGPDLKAARDAMEAGLKRQRTNAAHSGRGRGRPPSEIRRSSKVSKVHFCKGTAAGDCQFKQHDGDCDCADPDTLVLTTLGKLMELAQDSRACTRPECTGTVTPVSHVEGFYGNIALQRACCVCGTLAASFIGQEPLVKNPDESDNPGPAPTPTDPEIACHTIPCNDEDEPFAGVSNKHKVAARGLGAFGVKVHVGANARGMSGSAVNSTLALSGMRVPCKTMHSHIHLRASRDVANVLTEEVNRAGLEDVENHARLRQATIDQTRAAPVAAASSTAVTETAATTESLSTPTNNTNLSATATTTATTATTESLSTPTNNTNLFDMSDSEDADEDTAGATVQEGAGESAAAVAVQGARRRNVHPGRVTTLHRAERQVPQETGGDVWAPAGRTCVRDYGAPRVPGRRRPARAPRNSNLRGASPQTAKGTAASCIRGP